MPAADPRKVITTALEVAGLLLIVAAAALFVARYTLAGALLTAGVGLIGASALVTLLSPTSKPTPDDFE